MMSNRPGIVSLVDGAGIYAGAVTRSFGSHHASAPRYAGFNLCHYTGDTTAHWQSCRDELQKMLGKRLIVPAQTHSCRVAEIGVAPFTGLEGIDALVTRRTDVALVVNTADCLPVVFYDSRSGVIGIAHAGWRGLNGGILKATLLAMEHLASTTADIHAVIGPAICGRCYEVDSDFAGRFVSQGPASLSYKNIGRIVLPHPDPEKRFLDLKEAALQQLRALGVASASASPHCTRCDPHLWHSARLQGTASGRTATFVTLSHGSRS